MGYQFFALICEWDYDIRLMYEINLCRPCHSGLSPNNLEAGERYYQFCMTDLLMKRLSGV